MNKKGSSPFGHYMIGIAALFLAGFFLLVVFGAQSYRDTVSGQQDSMSARALSAYLATILKDNDRAGAVTVREDTSVGQVLIIGDEDLSHAESARVYAQRIYLSDGALVEDYALLDAPLSPDEAQVIGETDTFLVSKEGGRLTIRTDAGQITVFLRSEGGTDS